MRPPSRRDLLDEVRRLTAENERLTRLVATQRPELESLRRIEVGLRDYLDNGAKAIEELHEACVALLPEGDTDLTTFDELLGCMSDGRDRVEAALQTVEPFGKRAAK